jgi:hypothetical protein
MARRTVLYSSKGKKLYAVRDKSGKFKDIQQYSRAHAMDIKRKSKAEKAVGVKKKAKKSAAKKSTGRKTVKKSAVRRTAKKARRKTAARKTKKAAKKIR